MYSRLPTSLTARNVRASLTLTPPLLISIDKDAVHERVYMGTVTMGQFGGEDKRRIDLPLVHVGRNTASKLHVDFKEILG